MLTICLVASIILLTLIGFFNINLKNSDLSATYNFTEEFRKRFNNLAHNYFDTYDIYQRRGELSEAEYTWLISNSNKMQGIIGALGIIGYRAPFGSYVNTKYQVIISTIPKIRTYQIKREECDLTDDCLLRYLGTLKEKNHELEKARKNIFTCFRTGVGLVLSIPAYILNSFDIINDSNYGKFTGSKFFKSITDLTTLITAISVLVNLIKSMFFNK